MDLVELIQIFSVFHQQLEHLKTSIDALIKQENVFIENWKRKSPMNWDTKEGIFWISVLRDWG